LGKEFLRGLKGMALKNAGSRRFLQVIAEIVGYNRGFLRVFSCVLPIMTLPLIRKVLKINKTKRIE